MAQSTAIQRPRRWDNPLDPDLPDAKVDRIPGLPPIRDLNPDKFPASPRVIIRDDMRVLSFRKGGIRDPRRGAACRFSLPAARGRLDRWGECGG
jgi:hypothetical protein